jgi:lipopolysaccharide export system ATP-binding protein
LNTIVVDSLVKSFKKRNVVKGVSFNIEAGEVVGLLGPNGAGKTTSFYMIVGFIKADEGNIRLNDVDLKSPRFSRS